MLTIVKETSQLVKHLKLFKPIKLKYIKSKSNENSKRND